MDEYQIVESLDGRLYLMHSGRSKRDGAKVGSGRYPLGSGERPFQADESKRKHRGLFKKNKQKTLPKKLHEEEKKDDELTEEKKKQIIESGDISSAYKYRKHLTNAEIDAVILRNNKEKSLAELMPKKKTGMEYVEKTADTMQKVAKFVNSGINVWNASARVINTFTKYNLPTVKDVKDYPNKFQKYLNTDNKENKKKK